MCDNENELAAMEACRAAVVRLREAHATLYPTGFDADYRAYDEARADIASDLLDDALTYLEAEPE